MHADKHTYVFLLKGQLLFLLMSGPQLHSLPRISAPCAAAETRFALHSANLSVSLPDTAWPAASNGLSVQGQTRWGAANITAVQFQLTESHSIQAKHTFTCELVQRC